MRPSPISVLTLICTLAPWLHGQNQSSWVKYTFDSQTGEPEELVYTPWGPTGKSRIPDFSFAGYQRGSAIPDSYALTLDVETVSPDTDKLDDASRIQDAVMLIQSRPRHAVHGLRGIVQLEEGVFELYSRVDVTRSGVIIRGEMDPVTGDHLTKIDAAGGFDPVIRFVGSSDGPQGQDYGSFLGRTIASSQHLIVDDEDTTDSVTGLVGLGTNIVTVLPASNPPPIGPVFSVGDWVLVLRDVNSTWIDDLIDSPGVDCTLKTNAGTNDDWTEEFKDTIWPRTVVDVQNLGNGSIQLTLDGPMMSPLNVLYDQSSIFKLDAYGIIEDVGIEDILIKSCDQEDDEDDDYSCPPAVASGIHPRTAIQFKQVRNAWCKQVKGRWFEYALVATKVVTQHITIIGCRNEDPVSILEGGQRYAYNINGHDHLVYRCFSREGRHSFMTNDPDSTGIVFCENVCRDQKSDDGPHGGGAYGCLWDNLRMLDPDNPQLKGNEWAFQITCSDGDKDCDLNPSGKTLHGWTGFNCVAWNCAILDHNDNPTATIKVSHPNFGAGVRNLAIGCIAGVKCGLLTGSAKSFESFGTHISDIPSLYRQQLIQRTGDSWLPTQTWLASQFPNADLYDQ